MVLNLKRIMVIYCNNFLLIITENLKKYFEKYGEIIDSVVMTDKATGKVLNILANKIM